MADISKKIICDYNTSKGRLYQEPFGSDFRTCFQRDRDRIIHASSFRRLKHKTQVFVSNEGDHYRTRLTHTIEVAQVARSVSRALGLDEDLTEALALAHDLGHPPFGHAGENVLNNKMKDYGGFDHNAQTIKILTKLEETYAAFQGLNLTWETLEGIAKHNGPLTGKSAHKKHRDNYIFEYNKLHDLHLDKFSSLESQIASLSDDIAYNCHDIDDSIRAGLIDIYELSHIDLIGSAINHVNKQHARLENGIFVSEVTRYILKTMVYDLIDSTMKNVKENGIETAEDVRNSDKMIAKFSEELEDSIQKIKQFLMAKVYRNYKVNRMTQKAEIAISSLFDFYMDNPGCLPDKWSVKANIDDKNIRANVICDFIAGMTDLYAIKEYGSIFNLEKNNL